MRYDPCVKRAAKDIVAVVDSDLARRVAAVEVLKEAELKAFGVGSIDRLADDHRGPSLIVVRVGSQDEMRAVFDRVSQSARLVGTPLFVVGDAEAGMSQVEAFELGAVDFVYDDVEAGELQARVAARLHQGSNLASLSRKHRGAEVVLELTEALSGTLELHEILFLVVRRIAETVAVDRVSIVLTDDDDAAYVIAASDDEELRDLEIDLSKYPEIQRVLDTGRPLQIADASTHPLFDLAEVVVPSKFRSLVLVPISFEDRAMGVLFLRFGDLRQLDDEDHFVLHAVANATGIALRNAHLLHDMRDQSNRSRSARVEAEKRLKVLQRYVDFFDSAADGILVVTRRGEVLFCNPAACVIAGRSEQELRAGHFEQMLTPDGLERFAQVKASFEDGIFPSNIDLPIRTGDGRRRVLNVNFSSLLGDGGVIISLRDVTEDRALARELTKTKEFLQRVIDSSVDAIVSADMRGRVLLFNPAAERTYGLPAKAVVGKRNVRDLYPPGVASEIMRMIRSDDWGGPGVVQGYETELLGGDGTVIPVMLSASLIMHRGRPIGSVGVFRDLRAKIRIEERLRNAQNELAEQEQKAFIAELAGATAHELNQPLTTVMGYAGLIAKELDQSSRLGRAASAIVRETERMAEIVRKIGKLTKYESKAYVGETKIIDIERSIDSDPPDLLGDTEGPPIRGS